MKPSLEDISEHDLALAASIQQTLLPDDCPQLTKGQVAAGHRMCAHVGGDFYDFKCTSPGTFAVLIGDVMGHGVSAALLMTLIVELVRFRTRDHDSPDLIANIVNDRLISLGHQIGHVITCSLFYGVIHEDERRMSFVNCGHPAPIVCNRRLCLLRGLEATHTLLGVPGNGPIRAAEHKFEDEDRLVVFTDGVTDAVNRNRERFGVEGLRAFASENVTLSPLELIKATFAEIDSFCDGQPPQDDQSLVVVDFSKHIC